MENDFFTFHQLFYIISILINGYVNARFYFLKLKPRMLFQYKNQKINNNMQ